MIVIDYPEPSFRIKTENKTKYIFDIIRKQWVTLTPEEWVRQNFIQFLIHIKNYPAELIAVEKEIQLHDMKKRFDILVYSGNFTPWMMIECKSQDVRLDDKVLQQLLRYNISVPVPYLVITNGDFCYGWQKTDGKLKELDSLP